MRWKKDLREHWQAPGGADLHGQEGSGAWLGRSLNGSTTCRSPLGCWPRLFVGERRVWEIRVSEDISLIAGAGTINSRGDRLPVINRLFILTGNAAAGARRHIIRSPLGSPLATSVVGADSPPSRLGAGTLYDSQDWNQQ